MRENFFYFLITMIVVFACGLLPTLGANDILGATSWGVTVWGSLCGLITTVGGYWLGATIEGDAQWNTKAFVAQLIGGVIGGVLACFVFAFPGV